MLLLCGYIMQTDDPAGIGCSADNAEQGIRQFEDLLRCIGMKGRMLPTRCQQIDIGVKDPGRRGILLVQQGAQFIVMPAAAVDGSVLSGLGNTVMVIAGCGEAVKIDCWDAAQAEHDNLGAEKTANLPVHIV